MLRTCHDPPVRDRSRSVYYRVIGCSKRLHGFNSSAVEYNLFDQLLLISEAGHLLEKLQAAWARCGWVSSCDSITVVGAHHSGDL
ncbi:hypothetical protein PC121_g17311 [Phytophthora cactorum]|nr:hypothetical protein PC121_g17311 [Phytophthora cactorum]